MDLDVLFGTMLLGAPVVLIGTALIYLLVWLTGRRKGRTKTRNLAICLLAAYAILVWFATMGLELFLGFGLRPADWEWWYLLNLRPFDWLAPLWTQGWAAGWQEIQTGIVFRQLFLNVGMFVPFGFLLPVVFGRLRALWRTGLAGLLLTLCIETMQYFCGRSADIDDVIANFIGALIGYVLYRLAARLFAGHAFWNRFQGK